MGSKSQFCLDSGVTGTRIHIMALSPNSQRVGRVDSDQVQQGFRGRGNANLFTPTRTTPFSVARNA